MGIMAIVMFIYKIMHSYAFLVFSKCFLNKYETASLFLSLSSFLKGFYPPLALHLYLLFSLQSIVTLK